MCFILPYTCVQHKPTLLRLVTTTQLYLMSSDGKRLQTALEIMHVCAMTNAAFNILRPLDDARRAVEVSKNVVQFHPVSPLDGTEFELDYNSQGAEAQRDALRQVFKEFRSFCMSKAGYDGDIDNDTNDHEDDHEDDHDDDRDESSEYDSLDDKQGFSDQCSTVTIVHIDLTKDEVDD